MAQAARLNLRMQKELKLLLSDPPPGASFPTLSDDSSAPSLTSIAALFQGPQGTVYANGVFKINIKIPERYPFQPPIVTFATPIYHPNIDNGGRICLDILNLPPKGTWQPSLNISTVLTSIGLLLSEPNPDDGLMHEASREYKYNRQAFDQNARSMTDKYATAGESESGRTSRESPIHTHPNTTQTEVEGSSDASVWNNSGDHLWYHERFSGSGRKLSLESLGSSSNWDTGKKMYQVSIHDDSKNQIEVARLKKADNDSAKYNGNLGKLQAMLRNRNRNVETKNVGLANQCSALLKTQITATDSPNSSPFLQVGNIASNRREDYIESSHSSISVSLLQQPQLADQSDSDACTMIPGKQAVIATLELPKKAAKLPLDQLLAGNNKTIPSQSKFLQNDVRNDRESIGKFKQLTEGSQIPEAVIVLDSEDSEDENIPPRSNLSLPKRCLLRKRKLASGR